MAALPPSTVDVIPGLDPTGYTSITAAQLLQLVSGVTPYTDKGLIVKSTDAGLVPNVPNANSNAKWQNYLWLRQTTYQGTILYLWDTTIPADATLLNWTPVSLASLASNTVSGSKLIDNSVTSAKIVSLDWNKIISIAANSGVITGTYPNLDIAVGGVDSTRLASSASVSADRAVTANHIQYGVITSSHLSSSLLGDVTLPPGLVAMFSTADLMLTGTPPTGWLLCDGTEVAIATYPDLAAALYIGDANNADTDMEYGFKTDGAGTGTRTIAGVHIKIPDLRGQFVRGWNNSTSVGDDQSRAWASSQAGLVLAHTHTVPYSDGSHGSTAVAEAAAVSGAGITLASNANTGTENRPKNIVLAYCIKT